jgi:phenylacetate-CoA ligase
LAGEENKKRAIRQYNRFKPEVLYGYPSMINDFVNYAKGKGIRLYHPKIIVSHAENLYPDIKENLETVFPDSKIVNQYWATEANIAETCPNGNLHIDENTVIAELININQDGTGELYITNLFSYHLPLIRYKLGDRVKFSDERCSCGRNTRVISQIAGRDIDFLVLNDGRSYSVTSIYISNYAKNIHSYQIVHYKKENKIQFRYVPIDNKIDIETEKIKDLFYNNFELTTEFCPVNSIEYSNGGKFKKFVVIE